MHDREDNVPNRAHLLAGVDRSAAYHREAHRLRLLAQLYREIPDDTEAESELDERLLIGLGVGDETLVFECERCGRLHVQIPFTAIHSFVPEQAERGALASHRALRVDGQGDGAETSQLCCKCEELIDERDLNRMATLRPEEVDVEFGDVREATAREILRRFRESPSHRQALSRFDEDLKVFAMGLSEFESSIFECAHCGRLNLRLMDNRRHLMTFRPEQEFRGVLHSRR